MTKEVAKVIFVHHTNYRLDYVTKEIVKVKIMSHT